MKVIVASDCGRTRLPHSDNAPSLFARAKAVHFRHPLSCKSLKLNALRDGMESAAVRVMVRAGGLEGGLIKRRVWA
jgi:hypothetical protein